MTAPDTSPAVAPDDADPDGPAAEAEVPAAASKRRLPLECLAVAAIAWGWAAWLLRVWDMPKRLPIDTRSDATLISAMVKTMQERGWYLNQPRLGAPFGQQFYDFPHGGETIQLAAMKVLVAVTGDWGLAINLYFFFGFGVLAVVTFLVLRHLRFGPVIAGIAALAYTFLPYHFTHGEMHLWRSTYYSAPLGALLLVWLACWRERFLVEPGATGRGSLRGNLRWARIAGALAIAVVIGGTETMTASFTMTLLAAGAIVGAIRFREPARLGVAAALVATIGITFAVLSYPTLHYVHTYGTNEKAARRLVTESELYGVKLTRLVTPQGGHRLKLLSDLGAKSQEGSFVKSEGGQALGILGTAGFFGALWGAFAGRWRRERPDVRAPWDRSALRESATSVTLLALLFGVIGGFSVLLAMVGFSQVRVWDRIMLFIAFFAGVVVLHWAEQLVARIRARRPSPTPLLAVLAVAALAFVLWDGIPPVRKPYAAIEAQHASDKAFVAQIADVMPKGTAVFQLPVVEFPESQPVGKMLDYDHLRAYLADEDQHFRWSYGAIKGRPSADWQTTLRDQVGPIGALPALLGLGYTGLWIDTYGYQAANGQPDRTAEVQQIIDAVGVEPIRSPDGRFLFLDLRDFARRTNMTPEQLRQAAIDRLGVTPPEETS